MCTRAVRSGTSTSAGATASCQQISATETGSPSLLSALFSNAEHSPLLLHSNSFQFRYGRLRPGLKGCEVAHGDSCQTTAREHDGHDHSVAVGDHTARLAGPVRLGRRSANVFEFGQHITDRGKAFCSTRRLPVRTDVAYRQRDRIRITEVRHMPWLSCATCENSLKTTLLPPTNIVSLPGVSKSIDLRKPQVAIRAGLGGPRCSEQSS